jgi:FKBP-type peptidyl-prolyl cis-trans isomerase
MKKLKLFLLTVIVLNVSLHAEEPALLNNTKQKQSYSMGMDIGKRLKAQSVEIDSVSYLLGLKDAMSGDTPLLTENEMREILIALQKELKEKNDAKSKNIGELNRIQGEEFLAENQKKPDVITLPSGTQYREITKGAGNRPGPDDKVECHYRGRLLDGTEFDSSYNAGKPAIFPVRGVIRGWVEILQLMPAGSKWEVFIPSHLAYGEVGAAGVIGPHATLVFEIELISIK